VRNRFLHKSYLYISCNPRLIHIVQLHCSLPTGSSASANLPNGFNHFVVVWRTHGPFVQIMDPATGRRWSTHQRFLAEVYRYTVPFSAPTWRAWAETAGFVDPLRQRLGDLELSAAVANRLLETAATEESWRGFATLDAATRMVKSVVQAGGRRAVLKPRGC
jgi:ATP-binding cassette subfamily B protein